MIKSMNSATSEKMPADVILQLFLRGPEPLAKPATQEVILARVHVLLLLLQTRGLPESLFHSTERKKM
jgi:hypothetical protein